MTNQKLCHYCKHENTNAKKCNICKSLDGNFEFYPKCCGNCEHGNKIIHICNNAAIPYELKRRTEFQDYCTGGGKPKEE